MDLTLNMATSWSPDSGLILFQLWLTKSYQTPISRQSSGAAPKTEVHGLQTNESRPGIEIRLARFLGEIARRPFCMGQQDCGLMLADWCLADIGIDPARKIRGQYNSIDEAMHLLGVSSLPMVFGRLCRAAGIPLTTRPLYGDIAMIELGGSVRGAIVTSGYVTLSQGRGISRIAAARLVAAWSVHA